MIDGFSRREVLGLLPALPSALRAMAQIATSARLRRIASTSVVSYVIEPDGRVKVWTTDRNTKGNVLGFGDDRIVPAYVALEVPALKGCTAIAISGTSYAVTAEGRVLAWGANWNGLLGNTALSEFETTAQPHRDVPMPTATLGPPGVIDVACGENYALALTADGHVFAWGNGQAGQLGIGDMPVINFKPRLPEPAMYLPYPVRVPSLAGVTAIATGRKHSLALTKDGTVFAWGENQYGQLGDGTIVSRSAPVPVLGIAGAIAVAANAGCSVALLADGRVATWGQGNGTLGRPAIARGGPNPAASFVPGVSGITAISAGAQHVLALNSSGGVTAWGDQNAGQVGRQVNTSMAMPGPVPLVTSARAVYAMGLSSLAVLADGAIMAWGSLPSFSFRVDGADSSASHFPVPLIVKGL